MVYEDKDLSFYSHDIFKIKAFKTNLLHRNCYNKSLSKKSLSYNTILGIDILHKEGMFLISKIYMRPLDCTAKEHFVIKKTVNLEMEVRKSNKMLDEEYKIIHLRINVMNLNYLRSNIKNPF